MRLPPPRKNLLGQVSKEILKKVQNNDIVLPCASIEKSLASFRPSVLTTKNPYQPSLEKGRCKIAFTLAEVLITLGIIGVVAAITIPTIQAKYFEKMVVAKVKQTYSILGNAVNMMVAEQACGATDCYKTVSTPDIETIAGWVDKYFKYTEKVCVLDNDTRNAINWLPEFGYILNGTKTYNRILTVAYAPGKIGGLKSNTCYYKLNNGVNLGISRMNVFESAPKGGTVVYFVMDANGKQGPNRLGKDVFVFTSSTSSYSSSRNHALSADFALHAWASDSMKGGMCNTTWAYIKKKCPLDERTPTLYVLTYGKLPNLTKIGYPANP